MTKAKNNSSGIVYENFNTIKEEQNLNIEKSNTFMKRGNTFNKGRLKVCPAKETLCNICLYKGHFGRLCKSKGRRPVVNNVEENVNNQNCPYSPGNS